MKKRMYLLCEGALVPDMRTEQDEKSLELNVKEELSASTLQGLWYMMAECPYLRLPGAAMHVHVFRAEGKVLRPL